MHERNHELLDVKIRQYLLPAIMMKLALQLGNVVDTMLVGNLLGTAAMSAVSLSQPVLSFIQIPGYVLGNGGAIAAGILLGRRQKKEAKELFTAAFIITTICDLIFMATAFFATAPIAHLLSGGGTLEEDVASYLFVFLVGAPVLGAGLLMSSFFAGDSHPQLASAYFIISNAVNLVLDYVFLKFTPLGVAGAALSTILGFAVGFVVVVPYFRSKKRALSFIRPRITIEMMKNVFTAGMPYLTYLVAAMVKALFMNSIILSVLGESGMTVYTVCNNTALILMMLIGGVMGVVPNVASILYGEKDYYGIHVLYKKIIRYGVILTGTLMIILLLFTRIFTLLFGVTEPTLQSIMITVLRIYVFSMPFNMWNYFGMQYYGSVEKSSFATFITTLENGVFLIPAALFGILIDQRSGGSGYMGLAFAFVLSEALTVLASLIYRRLRYEKGSVLLIPDANSGICLDFTIRSSLEEAVSVAVEIKKFCDGQKVDESRANLIAVAAEEMVVNTVTYGGEQSKWIDVCFTVERTDGESNDGMQELLMLRLRDNGVPFDPTTYEYDTEDIEYSTHGIGIVRKMAKEISYIRAMDLNNTTITVSSTESGKI